jgi:tellurite resistance protein
MMCDKRCAQARKSRSRRQASTELKRIRVNKFLDGLIAAAIIFSDQEPEQASDF